VIKLYYRKYPNPLKQRKSQSPPTWAYLNKPFPYMGGDRLNHAPQDTGIMEKMLTKAFSRPMC
jgi:hypothetical protein